MRKLLFLKRKNTYLEASDWGWQIDPVGLRTTLYKIYNRYQIQMRVVENALGAADISRKKNFFWYKKVIETNGEEL